MVSEWVRKKSPPIYVKTICITNIKPIIGRKPLFLKIFSIRFIFSVLALKLLNIIRKINRLKKAVMKTIVSGAPFLIKRSLNGGNNRKKTAKAVI